MGIRALLLAVFLLSLISVSAMAQQQTGDTPSITPIDHATFVMRGREKTIYVDPVGEEKAFASFSKPDLILVTHTHFDHFVPKLVGTLRTSTTVIVAPSNVVQQLGFGIALENGQTTTVQGLSIEAVPAYNLSPDRTKYHPKGRDNGYVVTLDGKRIYISGDTEDTPEMRALKNIDIALVSMLLPYTMSPEQAASAILEMKPKVVLPYHYRGPETMSDVEKFKQLVAGNPQIKVRTMDWYSKRAPK